MNDASPATPEAVLAELLALYTDARRQRAFPIIDAVCRNIREHGGRFTVATVGKLSSKRRGPGAGTIANKDGAPYRRLIKAYADESGPLKPAAPPQDEEAELLSTVANLDHKALLRLKLADGRAWERKAKAAVSIANKSAALTLLPGPTAASMPTAEFGRREAIDLLPMERKALAMAFEGRRLARAHLRVDADGRLLDTSEASGTGTMARELMPAGFASALRKLAEAAGVPIHETVP